MTEKEMKKKAGAPSPEQTPDMGESAARQEGETDMAAALEEARAKLKENEERILRLAADFDNSVKQAFNAAGLSPLLHGPFNVINTGEQIPEDILCGKFQ